MYKLPDSPQKKALVAYLEQQIKENGEKAWINEGTSSEDEYVAMEHAYSDILQKIR